jgi:hypothetical protein
MHQTRKDWTRLFFRRDGLREQIYPTRVTYLALGVFALLGLALLLAGAASLREGMGLAALPAVTANPAQPSSGSQVTAAATRAARTALATSAPQIKTTAKPVTPAARCPITWQTSTIATQAGQFEYVRDENVTRGVRANFREAEEWLDRPSGPWNQADADQYFTPQLAAQMRIAMQSSLSRNEYTRITLSNLGVVSMTFTPDGAGVTFMSVQYEPITQTVHDAATGAVKRAVILNDTPYRLVGIAMLYDTQACRWKIAKMEYSDPVELP